MRSESNTYFKSTSFSIVISSIRSAGALSAICHPKLRVKSKNVNEHTNTRGRTVHHIHAYIYIFRSPVCACDICHCSQYQLNIVFLVNWCVWWFEDSSFGFYSHRVSSTLSIPSIRVWQCLPVWFISRASTRFRRPCWCELDGVRKWAIKCLEERTMAQSRHEWRKRGKERQREKESGKRGVRE